MEQTISANRWQTQRGQKINLHTLHQKFNNFSDSQAGNRTAWFLFALVFQGVLFLPLPAVLIYYYDAPVAVLAVTLGLFFANIIAGMGGASIRTLLGFFAAGLVTNVLMFILFLL
ncbi:hypothetical protein [Mucilaginibacter segetis]|uniref:Uncharacterized protein n=1 Tax=Mucilaginibacter segetis TaxID=2793071 RepID=A0A934PUG9_9SPHI|nr:hypothetical protein [Mucilaginibacter segetis]MBK0379605.1 hypothetical protein [Mucilaginibacter segetis]